MRTKEKPKEVKNATWNQLIYGNLLDTFLSNTNEMLWAIDTNKRIMMANEAYKRFVYELTGEHVKINDPVLPQVSDMALTSRWDYLYTRALKGEKFNAICSYFSGRRPSMLNTRFIPIVFSDQVMGSACIARNSKHIN